MMYEYMHVARYPSDFSIPNGMQYADGTPVMGASNAEGMKKNRNFQPIYRFISEMIQDRTIVTMECKQEKVQVVP